MWDWAGKATREARDFATVHALTFDGDDAPALPASLDAHPFEAGKRRLCVSGEWRGRPVQRFVAGGSTVELMTLPRPLPRLQVIPSGLERGAMAFGGRVVATGDPAFDRAVQVYADDADFALAFLSPAIREALLHPAASGRGLTVDGSTMYTWANHVESFEYARVRLDFLSVVAGRVPASVWVDFDLSPRHGAEAWVPAPARDEVGQWVVARVPDEGDEHTVSDTTEFEVSVLEAELDSTFVPEPVRPADGAGQWAIAPVSRY